MTWLIQRDPFNGWRGIQEDMNRIFSATPARPAVAGEGLAKGNWAPPVDIHEGEHSIILEADLPGLKPGDFNLAIDNNILTLSGERRREKSTPGSYHRVERQYGSFTRTFTLPATVDVEKVAAEFRHGVLRVTLPRREESRVRQIKVEVRSENELATKAAGEK